MASDNVVLYIKAERNVEVASPEVTIGDALQMECADPSVLEAVRKMRLYNFDSPRPEESESGRFGKKGSGSGRSGKRRVAVSILDVITSIQKRYPNVTIENIGESDFILTYEARRDTGGVVHILKVVLVFHISFVGAAFSTMAFNNDVDVRKMFAQIYRLLTGTKSDGFTVLELSYCIGVTIGILIFFNHFGKRRFCKEPTPIEVEMRLYENDVQTTLIENESRKGMG